MGSKPPHGEASGGDQGVGAEDMANANWPLLCQARPKLLETARKRGKGVYGHFAVLSNAFR
eukprot:15455907-Alexandrium_andersonii.AAC.1